MLCKHGIEALLRAPRPPLRCAVRFAASLMPRDPSERVRPERAEHERLPPRASGPAQPKSRRPETVGRAPLGLRSPPGRGGSRSRHVPSMDQRASRPSGGSSVSHGSEARIDQRSHAKRDESRSGPARPPDEAVSSRCGGVSPPRGSCGPRAVNRRGQHALRHRHLQGELAGRELVVPTRNPSVNPPSPSTVTDRTGSERSRTVTRVPGRAQFTVAAPTDHLRRTHPDRAHGSLARPTPRCPPARRGSTPRRPAPSPSAARHGRPRPCRTGGTRSSRSPSR
jgi:hypothetical protein